MIVAGIVERRSGINEKGVEIRPYRSTPVFDQDKLPKALRVRHDTKAGVWGIDPSARRASETYLSRSAF
jgi:hypothetical protein